MAGKPRAESPSYPVPVRLSKAERARAEQAARVNHQCLSEFMREALTGAAADCLEASPSAGA